MSGEGAGELKTLRQIADELHESKQRVYRNVKRNRIKCITDDAGVMWFGEVAQAQIKRNFQGQDCISDAHHEAHQGDASDAVNAELVAMLREQLAAKDRQIEELIAALGREQRLHAGTIQRRLTDGGFLSRLFGRSKPHE